LKVLLINPPLVSDNPDEPIPFPLGLGYLAASLRHSGFETYLIDACLGKARKISNSSYYNIGLTPAETAHTAADINPDVIGISVPFTSRYKLTLELFSEVRKRLPKTPVIAGGMHATVAPESLLDHSFDAVILGEAEESFPVFLKEYQTGAESLSDGIARRIAGKTVIKPQKKHVLDLDKLPFPARDLLPFDRYLKLSGGRWIRPGLKVASMITSRGCPYRCTFCSAFRVAGRRYRKRSAENVMAEIEELVHKYQVDVIAFEDDNLTADRKRAVAIFEGIARRFPKLQWITPNGVSIRDLDRDLIQLMKKSGCRSVNLAFESGDPRILKEVMKKDLDPEDGRQVRWWCREAGIAVNGYFILGMPGESRETMERTRDYALSLDLDGIGIFIATPFPGTELFDLCLKEGYLDPEYAEGDARFQSDPEVLHKPLIETPWLKKEELLAFHAAFEREFLRNYYRKRPLARIRKGARIILQKAGWGK
jgi:magnesium-protoporphyrin IX monomethyl ester (oxidative) cyclase